MDYNLVGGLVVGPILVALALPVLRWEARRRRDRRWFTLLLVALSAKLLGAMARYFVVYHVYHGVADAAHYDDSGRAISALIWQGIFYPPPESLPPIGTNFIEILTGWIYALIGPTQLGGFLVYSWLSFWGMFLFCRAFDLVLPGGRSWTYALLLFFLPTMMYWPSSIGKEAWMIFSLGVAAYGAALILTGRAIRGIAFASAGLWAAFMVRPHIGAITALALAAASILKRSSSHVRPTSPVVKLITTASTVAIAFLVVSLANQYLNTSSSGGVTYLLEETNRRSAQGGSEFKAPLIRSPAMVPLAVVTVLFRPFPFEAGNAQSVMAAAEGTLLLSMCLFRLRRIGRAVRAGPRRPYIVLALIFIGAFIFAFSGIANFGILVRQRAQVLPFVFVLMTADNRGRRRQRAGPRPNVAGQATKPSATAAH